MRLNTNRLFRLVVPLVIILIVLVVLSFSLQVSAAGTCFSPASIENTADSSALLSDSAGLMVGVASHVVSETTADSFGLPLAQDDGANGRPNESAVVSNGGAGDG